MTLRIVCVYPDLLGTYGDSGNAEVLLRRAAWRGIDATLTMSRSESPLPEGDLYCLGGGEDGPQVLAAQRLLDDGMLATAVHQGAQVFAVCAGFQIVGESFPDARGTIHPGVGLLDVRTTKGSGRRAVGEVLVDVAPKESGGLGLPTLTGFENHAGVTELFGQAQALGKVSKGIGNGAGERIEGAHAGNVIGTYLHGPVLARNPSLADELLCRALKVDVLSDLDDEREMLLRDERLQQVRALTK